MFLLLCRPSDPSFSLERLQIVSIDPSQINVANNEASGPLTPELQFARCMSNRYRSESFPRCVSCTRRWAGDTCRFQGIRFFLKDQQRNIVGLSFVESQKADAPTMDFPKRWNAPLRSEHIKITKVGVIFSGVGMVEPMYTPLIGNDRGGFTTHTSRGIDASRFVRNHSPSARERG